MKRQLPPLSSLRAFEAAARHLSFTKAGEELHVTQGAVSRHIGILEDYLRASLFNRLTRRVELTPYGRTYFVAISSALDAIEQVSGEYTRRSPTLSISVLPSTGALWLMQKLTDFACAYPEIRLDIHTSLDPVDWKGASHIDLAIRLGKLPGMAYDPQAPQIDFVMTEDWSGIAAVHLWDDFITPVCSKTLIERHGPIATPKDLDRHTLLYNNFRPDCWPAWLRVNDAAGVGGAARLDFSHSFLVANAVRAGLGVACLSTIEMTPVDWHDELVFPFESTVQSAGAYYLLAPEEKLHSHDVQLFLSWLKDCWYP